MAQNSSKFIANSLLALTSTMGLRSTSRALKYARAAFKLYFLTSTVGALASVIDSATLQELDEIAWVWCYCLGIPLITMDLCALAPYVPDISPFHLAIPMYTVLAYHIYPSNVDALLLSISHSISILFMAVCTAWDGQLCGFIVSFIHFFTLFRTDCGEKARMNWSLLSGMSNFFVIKLINSYY
nr:uncharacterized protein LOC106678533 [Halyomorpha halys]